MVGWLIMVGSAFVVLSAFDVIGGLRTLETREAVQTFLAEPPGSGLGLTVPQALEWLRISAMVAAACATASGVLGFMVLRGDRGARIGLSVLATPLFVSGLATGGFMSSVVAAAAVLLWIQPARAWFNGEPIPQRKRPRAAEPGDSAEPPPGSHADPELPSVRPGTPETGRPWQGFGDSGSRATGSTDDPAAPAAPETAPGLPNTPPPWTDTAWPPGAVAAPPAPTASGVPRPSARPGPVLAACLITWITCGIVLIGTLISLVGVLVAADELLEEALRQNPQFADVGLDATALTIGVVAMVIIVGSWSLVAALAAVAAFRRLRWGQILLIVSAVCAGLLSLVLVVSSPVSLLPALACVATVVLLLRSDVRAWYAG